jgi:hypothetical protein
MKTLFFVITMMLSLCASTFAQQSFYDLYAGNGNGIRFWQADAYKIHMGNADENKYGPVTDYSIKMNMNPDPARGWTWGIAGQVPVAAINTQGHMKIAGKLDVGTNIILGSNFGNKQIFTWSENDNNWRIGMSSAPGFSRVIATEHVQYITFNGSSTQGFAVGVNGGESSLEIGGNHQAFFRGNVGIGTSILPETKLHVYESGSSTGIWRGRVVASGSQNAVVLGEHNGKALFGAHNFSLNAWSDLVMQLGGNTGIGLENPSQKLTVNGNILQQAENSALGIDAQSNARFGIIKQFGSYPSIASDNASPIIFSQTNQAGIFTNISTATLTERMRIAVNGNVGIGTKSPDQKLTVKGKIHSEEVIVDLSVPAPDYVFEQNYSLTPLDEVQAYIAQHKHLPEVPSAKEMEKDGVKVGAMEMILLKKIEELTLYLLGQQAMIQNQQKEIEMLKSTLKN